MHFPRQQEILISVKKAISTNLTEALGSLSTTKGMKSENFKQARKAIKRARGALRLVEQGLTGKWLEKEEEILRDVARVFRDVRDSQVAEEVFDRVLDHFKSEHSPREFTSVREQLALVSKKTIDEVFSNEKQIKNTIANIQVALERVDELEIKGDPWLTIKEGIRETYKGSIDAFEDSSASRSDESYIDWRRQVKFLRVQLEYLKEFLSKEGESFNQSLHRLSDLLGEYQDIFMIQETVQEDKSSFGDKKIVNLASELFETRMKQVAKEARKLGEELFEQSPKNFMANLFNESFLPVKATG